MKPLLLVYACIAVVLLAGVWAGFIKVGSRSSSRAHELQDKWSVTILFILMFANVLGQDLFPVVNRGTWHISYPNSLVIAALSLGVLSSLVYLKVLHMWKREKKEVRALFCYSLFLFPIFASGAIISLNGLLDSTITKTYSAKILSKSKSSSGGSTTYKLRLTDWSHLTSAVEIVVEPNFYRAHNESDAVNVSVSNGAFGWERVRNIH